MIVYSAMSTLTFNIVNAIVNYIIYGGFIASTLRHRILFSKIFSRHDQ
ncbi:hypothetical protein SAMN05444682_111100 [Parapedobacter indicus]|uniref:Uncharacterized protein n=1 Tax=Parapedobacter indicus TaxID=1477437 RepID=A0A1I3SQ17_9SPHI|nr:hypothetical protein CLV26_11199 [Parapedobacter indicus]SFJ59537.1 hypothetical protein SAMN05444682_111100 [Parapedobacter indicus]